MNLALWIAQGLLALAFLAVGFGKVSQPKDKIRAARPQMGWLDDFSQPAVRAIGVAEIAGAVGLLLPGLTHVATILTPLAATGLALLMLGAIVVHVRRGEGNVTPVNLVLLLLAAFVAWGRFGPYPL